METQSFERILLHSEFQRRRKVNARFSLRAMAKLIGISPGNLSELLSGKRKLTPVFAHRIAEKLSLDPAQKRGLHRSLLVAQGLPPEMAAPEKNQLSEDAFEIIAEWYYYGILSLLQTNNFRSNNQWIAKRLGLTTLEVEAALVRLERLGYISRKSGKIKRTVPAIKTTTDLISVAIRRSHQQNLDQAKDAIEKVPLEFRDITSITMPTDLTKLKQAKELIKRFKAEMAELLESGRATEVYNFNMQLVPVTKIEEQT